MEYSVSNAYDDQNDNENKEKLVLEVKTVQSSAFRILIEAKKEILTDANLQFDETGIKVIAMDASHTVLVHLKLEAKNFESYYCPNKMILGVNMLNFFKLIKTMSNNDTLTLYVEQEDTLSAGVSRYSFPANSTVVDFETFRIKESDTLNNRTQKLKVLRYEEYLERFVEQEYTSDTSLYNVPVFVSKAPGLEYVLSPAPDQAYIVVYEYYLTSVEMIDATDVPKIPEIYRNVILDGAMYYAYMFRGNTQDALVAKEKFEAGLKNMRIVLINENTYVRSTMLTRSQRSTYVYRLAS